MIEVAGHTDSTGGDTKNFRLSQQRAESVIQYLAVNHKIPLRRFVTPMGYGKTEAVADNSTAAGRAQNSRAGVKMLLQSGINPRQKGSPAARTPQAIQRAGEPVPAKGLARPCSMLDYFCD